jgi:hypothetical protein
MKQNTIIYETGATSHAVNDLILFTDNTRELAAIRDSRYESFAKPNLPPIMGRDFRKLCEIAQERYIKEFPKYEDHKHISEMSNDQINEYCRLYAKSFDSWKLDHGYK